MVAVNEMQLFVQVSPKTAAVLTVQLRGECDATQGFVVFIAVACGASPLRRRHIDEVQT